MGGVGERLKYGWGAAEWESGRQQVGAGQGSSPMPGAYFIASGPLCFSPTTEPGIL